MKSIERIAKWLAGEIRFEWDMDPDARKEQEGVILDALYLARRTNNIDGDATLGRIIDRLKKQEAELRGRKTDISEAKADAISTIRDELVIYRSVITGGKRPYPKMGQNK